jgi:glutamyl-tRNA synthetase
VAQPIRVAVSGSTVSPPIFETLEFLGKTSTIARVEKCLASL